MIAFVIAAWAAGALLATKPAKPIAPVKLHQTETDRAGSPPFDLVPNETRPDEIAACRVEETLLMGAGVAEKRTCPPRLDAENARRRCKDMARHNALPHGVTGDSCLADYQNARFYFPGELKELITARRRDGATVATFEVLEGDILATFSPVSEGVLVGVGGGDRVHYAVVTSRGLLRAPSLGEEAVEAEAVHGRIRVYGKARAMQVDLTIQNGKLQVEKKK
jgi:hypothetical protein